MPGTRPGITRTDGNCQAVVDDVIHCSSFCFGAAPTWREASSPFLNSISVGIDMMPYFAAVAGFSSTLSFTILTLPFIVPAISSSAGAIMRHGPHHSAQKSTTTGSVLLSTSVSKVASDTFATPMAHLLILFDLVFGRRAPRDVAEGMDAAC